MKQVWKCDFCSNTGTSIELMEVHEEKCTFNKANKICYTCKHRYESGYYGESEPACDMDMDMFEGDDGKCKGWVYEYLENERDKKLTDIGI